MAWCEAARENRKNEFAGDAQPRVLSVRAASLAALMNYAPAVLVAAQQALHSRFDDFRQALRNNDRTALEIALVDFDGHLRRWTEAEEASLIPAVERIGVPGRDARRELRLEFVQLRELSGFLVRQIAAGTRARDLAGYVDNLERRLHAHEDGLRTVYYPAAASGLTPAEWEALLAAAPPA